MTVWLLENGCPFDDYACERAAAMGWLDILKRLRARGCPWTASTREAAEIHFRSEVLQWLDKNGCP